LAHLELQALQVHREHLVRRVLLDHQEQVVSQEHQVAQGRRALWVLLAPVALRAVPVELEILAIRVQLEQLVPVVLMVRQDWQEILVQLAVLELVAHQAALAVQDRRDLRELRALLEHLVSWDRLEPLA